MSGILPSISRRRDVTKIIVASRLTSQIARDFENGQRSTVDLLSVLRRRTFDGDSEPIQGACK